MLTNYDMDSTTPFAVLLIGQPTLRKQMKHGVLAALDQRIAISYQMPTMNKEETSSYIKHHLTIAGRSDPLFSDDAVGPDPPHQPRPAPLGQQHRPAVPDRRVRRRRRASSTSPPPASPSPRPTRQSDHEADTVTTKTPAA